VDSAHEWQIHDEVKRLVRRQGLQDICLYLLQMVKEKKILLPPMPSVATMPIGTQVIILTSHHCGGSTLRRH
jgi:hypothetical protein